MATAEPATCSAQGCAQPAVIPCAYTDRHGVACGTRWCADHAVRHGEELYCRRHADTMAGVTSPFDDPPPLPDIANRAASLLHWMAEALDTTVVSLLDARRNPMTEDRISDWLGAAATPRDPEAENRDWVRRWQIVDHASGDPVIVVRLTVTEADDDTVAIAVNGDEMHRATPPWITARRKGATDAAVEARKRRTYEEDVVAVLTAAVDRIRPATL